MPCKNVLRRTLLVLWRRSGIFCKISVRRIVYSSRSKPKRIRILIRFRLKAETCAHWDNLAVGEKNVRVKIADTGCICNLENWAVHDNSAERTTATRTKVFLLLRPHHALRFRGERRECDAKQKHEWQEMKTRYRRYRVFLCVHGSASHYVSIMKTREHSELRPLCARVVAARRSPPYDKPDNHERDERGARCRRREECSWAKRGVPPRSLPSDTIPDSLHRLFCSHSASSSRL